MPGQKMDGLFKGWWLFKISYTEERERRGEMQGEIERDIC